MTKLVILAVATFGVLTLGGCAPAPLTKADVDGLIVCNLDQMDQVERKLHRTFAQIIWMNCPTYTLRAT